MTDTAVEIDGGRRDETPPTVIDTTPTALASGVSRDLDLVVRFSEPMLPASGTVTIEPGGTTRLASAGIWSAAGDRVTLPSTGLLPIGDVTVTVGIDFRDLAGNPLRTHTFSFTTVDDVAPVVVASVPAEAATGLSARIDAIDLTFDEPMRTTAGTIDVLGGAATVGAETWSADGRTASFPIADLEYLRDYQVVVRGFRDVAGNDYDDAPYLEDGVLDFSTGADADGPRVVRSEPAEGQLDVNPADATSILVTFDEAMDTTVAAVVLSDGTTDTPLTGTWTGSARILRVETTGLLAFGNDYTLDLAGLRDRAGNAIDGAPYLGDGLLDFSVGLDAFLPFVRTSVPAESEAGVDYTGTSEVTLTFSEAMETVATSVPVSVNGVSSTRPARWTSATELVVDVVDLLPAGGAIAVDVRGLRDLRGNVLDATHRYLGDGELDFTTGPPSGEGCRDPLTVAEATETAGSWAWTIGSLDAAVRDGGTASCDPNGTTANGTDVLVRFDKVSGDLASGGRWLHLVVEGGSGTATTFPYDVAVMTGASCSAAATPVSCQSNAALQDTWLDLPAGPVWIWLSRTISSTTTASITLTVSESAGPRTEGDACAMPFTEASAVHTAPTAGDPVHHWTIPENAVRSVDATPTTNVPPGVFSCDANGGHGIDGVIRFDKPDDASVLRVTARRTSGSDVLDVGAWTSCTPSAGTALACRTDVSGTAQSFLVDAPAGPVYLWYADASSSVSRSSSMWQTSPGVTFDVEIVPDVDDGEICSRALAAAIGTTPVAGTSDLRLDPPSCMPTTPLEWYRIRSTGGVLSVATDVAGSVAIVDPTTLAALSCTADAMASPVTRVLPAGTDVCIAVEMGRGVSSLAITSRPYDGLGARPPVDLGILRPFSTSGTEETVTADVWMVVSGSTLVEKYASTTVLDVGIGGGERAARRGSTDGITSTMIGRTAVAVDGAVFSFSSTTSTTSARVTRLWDGRSAIWSPTVWDTGTTYPTSAIMAAAADGTDIVYVTDATVPTFFRISTLAPGPATSLGTLTGVGAIRGLASDDTYFYVAAMPLGVSAILRVPRATPTLLSAYEAIAPMPALSTSTGQATPMALDRPVAPRYLYVRTADGSVEAIADPAGAAPAWLGPVIDRGVANDWAMAIDPATGSLYLFESESLSTGTWLRYDPETP